MQPKDEHAKFYGSPAANVDSPRKEAVALNAMSAADIGTHYEVTQIIFFGCKCRDLTYNQVLGWEILCFVWVNGDDEFRDIFVRRAMQVARSDR